MFFSTRLSFFFSSRRRHTRLQGDWSSDVCSSDLAQARIAARDVLLREFDAKGEQRADRDDATRQDAGEGERDAERDEEDEVLDQLGEIGRASCRERVERWVDGGS